MSHPAPKAIRPTASGFPPVRSRAISGTELAVPAADEAVDAALSLAAAAVLLAVSPMPEAVEAAMFLAVDAPLAVLPMILSFTLVTAVRVRRARRWMIRGGLSFSVSASTSAPSSRWVCWMSPRIWSGSLVTGFSSPAP
jgi:hypothetical protein